MPIQPLSFDDVRALALALPGVTESSLHGAPSLKLAGRLLACPALHQSAEVGSVMVRIGLEQRAALLAADPAVYYVTEHYLKHPAVLVRLERLKRAALKKLLGLAWHFASSASKAGGRIEPSRLQPNQRRATTPPRKGSRRKPPSRRGASRRAGLVP